MFPELFRQLHQLKIQVGSCQTLYVEQRRMLDYDLHILERNFCAAAPLLRAVPIENLGSTSRSRQSSSVRYTFDDIQDGIFQIVSLFNTGIFRFISNPAKLEHDKLQLASCLSLPLNIFPMSEVLWTIRTMIESEPFFNNWQVRFNGTQILFHLLLTITPPLFPQYQRVRALIAQSDFDFKFVPSHPESYDVKSFEKLSESFQPYLSRIAPGAKMESTALVVTEQQKFATTKIDQIIDILLTTAPFVHFSSNHLQVDLRTLNVHFSDIKSLQAINYKMIDVYSLSHYHQNEDKYHLAHALKSIIKALELGFTIFDEEQEALFLQILGMPTVITLFKQKYGIAAGLPEFYRPKWLVSETPILVRKKFDDIALPSEHQHPHAASIEASELVAHLLSVTSPRVKTRIQFNDSPKPIVAAEIVQEELVSVEIIPAVELVCHTATDIIPSAIAAVVVDGKVINPIEPVIESVIQSPKVAEQKNSAKQRDHRQQRSQTEARKIAEQRAKDQKVAEERKVAEQNRLAEVAKKEQAAKIAAEKQAAKLAAQQQAALVAEQKAARDLQRAEAQREREIEARKKAKEKAQAKKQQITSQKQQAVKRVELAVKQTPMEKAISAYASKVLSLMRDFNAVRKHAVEFLGEFLAKQKADLSVITTQEYESTVETITALMNHPFWAEECRDDMIGQELSIFENLFIQIDSACQILMNDHFDRADKPGLVSFSNALTTFIQTLLTSKHTTLQNIIIQKFLGYYNYLYCSYDLSPDRMVLRDKVEALIQSSYRDSLQSISFDERALVITNIIDLGISRAKEFQKNIKDICIFIDPTKIQSTSILINYASCLAIYYKRACNHSIDSKSKPIFLEEVYGDYKESDVLCIILVAVIDARRKSIIDDSSIMMVATSLEKLVKGYIQTIAHRLKNNLPKVAFDLQCVIDFIKLVLLINNSGLDYVVHEEFITVLADVLPRYDYAEIIDRELLRDDFTKPNSNVILSVLVSEMLKKQWPGLEPLVDSDTSEQKMQTLYVILLHFKMTTEIMLASGSAGLSEQARLENTAKFYDLCVKFCNFYSLLKSLQQSMSPLRSYKFLCELFSKYLTEEKIARIIAFFENNIGHLPAQALPQALHKSLSEIREFVITVAPIEHPIAILSDTPGPAEIAAISNLISFQEITFGAAIVFCLNNLTTEKKQISHSQIRIVVSTLYEIFRNTYWDDTTFDDRPVYEKQQLKSFLTKVDCAIAILIDEKCFDLTPYLRDATIEIEEEKQFKPSVKFLQELNSHLQGLSQGEVNLYTCYRAIDSELAIQSENNLRALKLRVSEAHTTLTDLFRKKVEQLILKRTTGTATDAGASEQKQPAEKPKNRPVKR